MTDDKLKPCPFCGGNNVNKCSTLPNGQAWICCDDCEMDGPHSATEAEAITAWNQRATDTQVTPSLDHARGYHAGLHDLKAMTAEENAFRDTQVSKLPIDSGMSGDAVELAEMVWGNLPTGNRTWAGLATHEKALVCHTIARLQSAQVSKLESAAKAFLAGADKGFISVKVDSDFRAALDGIVSKSDA